MTHPVFVNSQAMNFPGNVCQFPVTLMCTITPILDPNALQWMQSGQRPYYVASEQNTEASVDYPVEHVLTDVPEDGIPLSSRQNTSSSTTRGNKSPEHHPRNRTKSFAKNRSQMPPPMMFHGQAPEHSRNPAPSTGSSSRHHKTHITDTSAARPINKVDSPAHERSSLRDKDRDLPPIPTDGSSVSRSPKGHSSPQKLSPKALAPKPLKDDRHRTRLKEPPKESPRQSYSVLAAPKDEAQRIPVTDSSSSAHHQDISEWVPGSGRVILDHDDGSAHNSLPFIPKTPEQENKKRAHFEDDDTQISLAPPVPPPRLSDAVMINFKQNKTTLTCIELESPVNIGMCRYIIAEATSLRHFKVKLGPGLPSGNLLTCSSPIELLTINTSVHPGPLLTTIRLPNLIDFKLLGPHGQFSREEDLGLCQLVRNSGCELDSLVLKDVYPKESEIISCLSLTKCETLRTFVVQSSISSSLPPQFRQHAITGETINALAAMDAQRHQLCPELETLVLSDCIVSPSEFVSMVEGRAKSGRFDLHYGFRSQGPHVSEMKHYLDELTKSLTDKGTSDFRFLTEQYQNILHATR
ncbi:hypothetical protein DXG01_006140 [Tephrocybe rancida]|nr:hypothetical protein DXG01_006140 [Tephrocybe rancida]